MKEKKTLESWMAQVDAAVQAKCGLSVYDLPDCCFADWFEEGASPKAAASRAVRNAKDE